MRSLERRLQLGLVGSLIILFGILGWLLNFAIERALEEFALSRLRHDGENLLAVVQVTDAGFTLPRERINTIYQRAFSGHYYQISAEGMEVLRSRSLWDTNLAAPLLPPGKAASWRGSGPNGQQLLFWAGGYEKGRQQLTIILGEDITALLGGLAQYRLLFAGMTLLVLIVSMTIQSLVVRRSFRNLRSIGEAVDHLEAGEISELPEDVPGEVLPLVREVNRLLRMMGQRLQRLRNSVGNLAHALKGPINLLTQIGDGPPGEDLREEVKIQTGRMHQLVEHELRRARLAGSVSPGRHFKPSEELPVLADLLRRIHRDKALEFDLRIEPTLVMKTDRDDMLELFGNLLDNAAKWAAGTVRCEIVRREGIQITVEDDGPGCSEEQMHTLLQRGRRLDEGMPGYGLGLAIVKDIVELYDARLMLDRSPELKGLRIRIAFQ